MTDDKKEPFERDFENSQAVRIDLTDPKCLNQLLEKYRPWCKLYLSQRLFSQLGKRLDDSDVIQAAWIQLVANQAQFRGTTESEFFAWMKKILDNKLKNILREETAQRRDFRREHNESDTATLSWWEPTSRASSPSERIIQGEQVVSLAKAIEQLPKMQRQAIELRHLMGKGLAEVSSEMSKSPDAVVSLLRRGIIRLRKILD